MDMSIGAGIAIGCAILGGVAALFKIFGGRAPSNPGMNPGTKMLQTQLSNMSKKVRYADTCVALREGLVQQNVSLKDAVDTGFKSINDQLKEIRERLP